CLQIASQPQEAALEGQLLFKAVALTRSIARCLVLACALPVFVLLNRSAGEALILFAALPGAVEVICFALQWSILRHGRTAKGLLPSSPTKLIRSAAPYAVPGLLVQLYWRLDVALVA